MNSHRPPLAEEDRISFSPPPPHSPYAAAPPRASSRPLDGAPENNRGRLVQFDPKTETGQLVVGAQRKDVAFTPKLGGEDAEAIAVTLGLSVPDLATEPVDLAAVLTWGAGGATFEAEVDWERGAVVVVHASSVRVSAVYTTVAQLSAAPPPVAGLSASFSYGGTGRRTAPKRTRVLASLAAAAVSPLTRVPSFASAVTLLASATPATMLLRFYADASGLRPALAVRTVTEASDAREGAITLPNGAAYFTVENSGASAVTPRAVFALSL